jgi:hypothetical protein
VFPYAVEFLELALGAPAAKDERTKVLSSYLALRSQTAAPDAMLYLATMVSAWNADCVVALATATRELLVHHAGDRGALAHVLVVAAEEDLPPSVMRPIAQALIEADAKTSGRRPREIRVALELARQLAPAAGKRRTATRRRKPKAPAGTLHLPF